MGRSGSLSATLDQFTEIGGSRGSGRGWGPGRRHSLGHLWSGIEAELYRTAAAAAIAGVVGPSRIKSHCPNHGPGASLQVVHVGGRCLGTAVHLHGDFSRTGSKES